ncbi:MAG: hypothetical protein R3276_01140 [Marinobacter sp.]|nr:hypothetical protein [Marinobacter sp.]
MKAERDRHHSELRHDRGILALLVLLLVPMPSMAELRLSEFPLSDEVLATQQGGFVVGDLEIAIGLEQLVAVNGETMVVSRLHIPNLNQKVGRDVVASQLETALAVPDLGEGTVIDTHLVNGSGVLTRIQNSMNETVIQTLRRYNIELNNIERNGRLPGALDSQYLQTLKPH